MRWDGFAYELRTNTLIWLALRIFIRQYRVGLLDGHTLLQWYRLQVLRRHAHVIIIAG